MMLDSQNILLRTIIAIPFGIGAIFLFIKGIKRSNRFFFRDYQGNSKERFKDNFVSNLYLALSVACLIQAAIVFSVDSGNLELIISFIPVALCLGVFILPIGILGAYWRSYTSNKLWGGFMPMVREKYGYVQPETRTPKKINPTKLKLPRRRIFTALGIALLVFGGTAYLLSGSKWNAPAWAAILITIFIAALISFGVFMTILSASLSHRIQKMRDGDPLDKEDD